MKTALKILGVLLVLAALGYLAMGVLFNRAWRQWGKDGRHWSAKFIITWPKYRPWLKAAKISLLSARPQPGSVFEGKTPPGPA